MILVFEKDALPEPVFRELGFEKFLELFNHGLPLIPSKILRPLSRKEGIAHFKLLADVETKLGEYTDMLTGLSKSLPKLDGIMPFFESGMLQQYHLHELGRFLTADTELVRHENNYPVAGTPRECVPAMLSILQKYTEDNYSVINSGTRGEKLKSDAVNIDKDLMAELKVYEKQILSQTGFKMIYPYPKEVILSEAQITALNESSLVSIEKTTEMWRIDYTPGTEMTSLVSRRERLINELDDIMQEKLSALNNEIRLFYEVFSRYYQERKKRTWIYLLLFVKQNHDLSLPEFTATIGCSIKGGYVYSLFDALKEDCVPLDVELNSGSNVLYGANMSGKTTVLKTVFFLLTCIRFGLPVPAKSIRLSYPEDISMLLKSSGDMSRNISTFSEEILFFTKPSAEGAYILCDELFLSTDPVNGATLSDIFIKDYSTKQQVFLCTTHYAQALDIKNIRLLGMLEPDPDKLSLMHTDIKEYLKKMPYKIIAMPAGNSELSSVPRYTPLKIALLFPLPGSIKEKIKMRLE